MLQQIRLTLLRRPRTYFGIWHLFQGTQTRVCNRARGWRVCQIMFLKLLVCRRSGFPATTTSLLQRGMSFQRRHYSVNMAFLSGYEVIWRSENLSNRRIGLSHVFSTVTHGAWNRLRIYLSIYVSIYLSTYLYIIYKYIHIHCSGSTCQTT